MQKEPYTTVSVDRQTKQAIKDLSVFTKVPIVEIVRSLLIKLNYLDTGDNYNTFHDWNEETLIRFRRFLQLRDEKK